MLPALPLPEEVEGGPVEVAEEMEPLGTLEETPAPAVAKEAGSWPPKYALNTAFGILPKDRWLCEKYRLQFGISAVCSC